MYFFCINNKLTGSSITEISKPQQINLTNLNQILKLKIPETLQNYTIIFKTEKKLRNA